ncbi:hypothetical protein Q3G72_007000 [Acer saccharum]|nr:hypothetical protein Q3G72_007000 [Acer saccharum]
MAMSWLNDDDIVSLEHVNIINEIRSFMVMQGRITVMYNSRISNTLADNLAKKGAGMNEDVMSPGSLFLLAVFGL